MGAMKDEVVGLARHPPPGAPPSAAAPQHGGAEAQEELPPSAAVAGGRAALVDGQAAHVGGRTTARTPARRFWADVWAAGIPPRACDAVPGGKLALQAQAGALVRPNELGAAQAVDAAEAAAVAAEKEAAAWVASLAEVRKKRAEPSHQELEQAKAELEASLAERRRQIEVLEEDVLQKNRAIHGLRTEIATSERRREASLVRAAELRQLDGWTTREVAAEGGENAEAVRLVDLEIQLASREAEEQNMLKAVEELERDMRELPESERQRLWWLERVSCLELEFEKCKQLVEPLDEEFGTLERRRASIAQAGEDLGRRLEALEAAYASVGVEVRELCGPDGRLDPVDVNLAICMAVMPQRVLDFLDAQGCGGGGGECQRRSQPPPLIGAATSPGASAGRLA